MDDEDALWKSRFQKQSRRRCCHKPGDPVGNASGGFVDPVTSRFQRSYHVLVHGRTAVVSSDGVSKLTEYATYEDRSIRNKGIHRARLQILVNNRMALPGYVTHDIFPSGRW